MQIRSKMSWSVYSRKKKRGSDLQNGTVIGYNKMRKRFQKAKESKGLRGRIACVLKMIKEDISGDRNKLNSS